MNNILKAAMGPKKDYDKLVSKLKSEFIKSTGTDPNKVDLSNIRRIARRKLNLAKADSISCNPKNDIYDRGRGLNIADKQEQAQQETREKYNERLKRLAAKHQQFKHRQKNTLKDLKKPLGYAGAAVGIPLAGYGVYKLIKKLKGRKKQAGLTSDKPDKLSPSNLKTKIPKEIKEKPTNYYDPSEQLKKIKDWEDETIKKPKKYLENPHGKVDDKDGTIRSFEE